DYGMSQAAIVVRVGAAKETLIPISLPRRSTIERGTWVGQSALDLGSQSSGAPRIEVQVEVRDNRPDALGGPQPGRSKPLVIIFDANAQSYANQTAEEAVRRLTIGLNEALALLVGAKRQLSPLRPNLEKLPLRLPAEPAKAVESARSQTIQAEA